MQYKWKSVNQGHLFQWKALLNKNLLLIQTIKKLKCKNYLKH